MKRKFLTDLGLDSEQVDKVMKEHGETVNGLKDELEGIDSLKQQIEDQKATIEERDTQLNTLSETAKGNEELTKEIEDLKTANTQTQADYQSKLDKQAFDFKLEKELTGAKARNPKAVKALLNIESLKLNGDKLEGLEDQLKTLQESDAYLFGEDEPNKLGGRTPVPSGNGVGQPTKNPFSKDSFNLTEQMKLVKEKPVEAKQLVLQAGGNPATFGL
ncbi:phage scaffolding protein [Paraliobacillus sediminis]|uniref:phage scaffolding protein n=1 Tax=Paraliobacillus sediminis TaxID=1885916 RepID=UPI000E3E76E5|nr:phage scaffolding protein [Paraliobacillus sediminis]